MSSPPHRARPLVGRADVAGRRSSAPSGRHHDQLLHILVEFATTMTADFSVRDILDHLTAQIVDLLPIDGAGVLLMDAGPAGHHLVSATDDRLRRIEGLQVDLGEGPCLTAYERDEVIVVPDLTADTAYPRFSPAAVAAGLGAVFAFPLRHGDARIGALEIYARRPITLGPDEIASGQTLADVTASYLVIARRREEAARAGLVLAEAAVTDPLTGLPNRRLLHDRLTSAADRSVRSHRVTAVLFCDLDRFKAVNDRYGHHVGDRLLVAVAARLATALRPEDTLARVSGDEFVAVCEGLDDAARADEVAARMLATLDDPLPLTDRDDGPTLRLGMSIGVAVLGPGCGTTEQTLVRADAAMYRAKRRGGHRVVTADSHTPAEISRDHVVEAELPSAIAAGELSLAYQPVVEVATARWAGVEALLRWDHPTHGPIAPGEILAAAERTGLTLDLATWILRTACGDLHRWHDDGYADEVPTVAVNVSFAELLHPGHPAAVRDALAACGLPAHRLCLEVTEQVPLEEDGDAAIRLEELTETGIEVALDDFGTGYSSLAHLQAFPVHVLKLDRSFVARRVRTTDAAIVRAVAAMAHELGIRVVAEGIETDAQLRQTRSLGIELVQGYLLARPVAGRDVVRTLVAHRERRMLADQGHVR